MRLFRVVRSFTPEIGAYLAPPDWETLAMDAVDERSQFSRIDEERFAFSIAEALGQVLAGLKHAATLIFRKKPKAYRYLC